MFSKRCEQVVMEKLKLNCHWLIIFKVNEALSLVEITSMSAENLHRDAEEARRIASSLNKTFADQLTSISTQKSLSYTYLDDVTELLKAIDTFKMPNFTQQDIASEWFSKVLPGRGFRLKIITRVRNFST